MYHAKSSYHDATMYRYMINMPENDFVISLIKYYLIYCTRVLLHYFHKNAFKSLISSIEQNTVVIDMQ